MLDESSFEAGAWASARGRGHPLHGTLSSTETNAEATYGNASCEDSNVQYLGGGAYQTDAGNNVTRTTPAKT
jgi:hypothetical protein